ncbi:lateral flagellar capping protein LafB [Aeromonas diversa]|uniref:Flagellar hook-associated protein 2 n=1 Tax=Aeromonas diversa CDC 2478-85 TaxID=1268237 RepID=N9V7Y5_9GAMM|nr:lateral flagellar capping protein LafB [Aeromonas diversa]ENY71397.1 LafB [Aeromonas diversa CDC 2478-85]
MMVDPATMATQLVAAERLNMDRLLKKQQESFKSQLSAMNGLNTKLSSFQTQLKELNKASTLQAQKATVSQEGMMTVTSNGKAASGQYNFFINQLAQTHQVGIKLASESDPLPSSGEFSLTVDGKSIKIDLATLAPGSTVKDLVSQINNATGNDKVRASLVRNNGEVNLVLASRESGIKNAITIDFSGDPASALGQATLARKDITAAQDAIVTMGSGPGAIAITSASNKLENVVEGLTINLTKAQKAGDAALQITVSQDTETVTGALKKFVESYNGLVDELGKLTASDPKNPGALSGDSSTRALKSKLANSVRDLPDGMSLASLGIKTDRNGKLSFSESDFNKALEKDPELLSKALMGDSGLLKKMISAVDPFTARDGVFKRNKDSIEKSQRRVEQRMEALDRKMDAAYKRYLNQFSLMSQMQQTMQGI